MSFNKPSDIALMFGVFALVLITVGFGIDSIAVNQNVTANTNVITYVQLGVNSSLNQSAVAVTGSLINTPGLTDTTSQENIFVRGFNSVLNIGSILDTMITNIQQFGAEFGINAIYFNIAIAILIITFAVITYTWFRGGYNP